jgi:hypothetical protein
MFNPGTRPFGHPICRETIPLKSSSDSPLTFGTRGNSVLLELAQLTNAFARGFAGLVLVAVVGKANDGYEDCCSSTKSSVLQHLNSNVRCTCAPE